MYFILLYKRQTTVKPSQATAAIADEVRDRTPTPDVSTLETSEQNGQITSELSEPAPTQSQSTLDCMKGLEQVKQTYFLERRNFW